MFHATVILGTRHTTIPRLAPQSVLDHPAGSITLVGMSTMTGVQANGGVMGAWHDAALPTGGVLTPNWRIDVDPVETL